MSTRLDPIIKHAIDEHVLPAGAALAVPAQRPWPIVALSFFGAWLAVLPLMVALGIWWSKWIFEGSGAFVVGSGLLALATMVLRREQGALFIEQLAFPALLIGGSLLGIGMFEHLPEPAAAGTMALVSLALGYGLKQDWLRVLLGALGAAFTVTAITTAPRLLHWGVDYWSWYENPFFLLALQLAAAAWLAVELGFTRIVATAGEAAGVYLDRTLLGWAVALLAGLSVGASETFLVSELVPFGPVANGFQAPVDAVTALPPALSVVMGLAAVWLLVRSWPPLAKPWFLLPAVAVAGVGVTMPALGPGLLVLCMAALGARWTLATAAGLACVWILGGFYYSLSMTLTAKAGLLLAMACGLGLAAWWKLKVTLRMPHFIHAASTQPALARVTLGLGGVLILIVINGAIWQKQQLISNSRAIYVELAPVDPRSLMQGDFMRLAFRLPELSLAQERGRGPMSAVGTVDARGIVRLTRLHDGKALRRDEIQIELVEKDGRRQLVTDAWYFEEGTARRWEKAKYGEFRVDPNGKALLVGLRGPQLDPL